MSDNGLTVGSNISAGDPPSARGIVSARDREDPHYMRSLAAKAAEELEDASAQEIIRWATDTFGGRICITSSMTDAVLIHLASSVRPGIEVVFLDTGYHFPYTIGPRATDEAESPLPHTNVNP